MPIIEDPFYTSFAAASSSPPVRLDIDSLYEVFDQFVQMAPIHNAVALRSANWQVCRAINYALYKTTTISVELKWHKDRLENPEPEIIIQGSQIRSLEKAEECIDFIFSHARMITHLSIDVEVAGAGKYLNALLEKFIGRENVQLEVLKIRRRYIGESFPIISDLIYEHASTLKIVGRIGLTEAVEGFTQKLHLQRLSLMNFDLIDDATMDSPMLFEKTRYCMRKIADTGATFEHLSYTTYCGFEIARQPTLQFLRSAEVQSLRVTMQEGNPLPYSDRVILETLKSLEFVGDMDIESDNLAKQFPNLSHFDFVRQNLACCGA
jgi:hypothetical protein